MKYLNKNQRSQDDDALIFQYIYRKQLFSLNVLNKLHLQNNHLEQLLKSKMDRDRFSELLITITDKPCLNIEAMCQILRQLLITSYFNQTPVKANEIFIRFLFYLLNNDANKQQLIQVFSCHIHQYLQSNALHIPLFFQQALLIQGLHFSLQNFMQKIIYRQISISVAFEEHILQSMLQIIEIFPSLNKDHIFEYICFKMKSLDKNTRQYANEIALKFPITKAMVQLLIHKDIFGSNQLHKRGALLQVLEDQYKDIRMTALHCLEHYLEHLNTNEVKQIILYMINDESDEVRGEALQTLTLLSSQYNVSKQELQIIFTPLKQKSRLLRHLCYKVMQIVSLSFSSNQKQNQKLFIEFINKLFTSYNSSKEDKRFLYNVMHKLGRRYSHIIIKNIHALLDSNYQQEPSWKSFIHKAKIILIANAFAPNYLEKAVQYKALLPRYFVRHYEYIKDIQPYAFDQPENCSYLGDSKLFYHDFQEQHKYDKQVIKSQKLFVDHLPIDKSTSKERFFYLMLVISQKLLNLESMLKKGMQGVYFIQLATEILLNVAAMRSRFENWNLPIVEIATITSFQYFFLAKLSPLQYNPEQFQQIIKLNNEILTNYLQNHNLQNFNSYINTLLCLNQQALKSLQTPSEISKQLKKVLIQNLLFQPFYSQLKHINHLTLSQPSFDIQVDTSLSKIYRQYKVQLQVTDLVQSITRFRLKFHTSSSQTLIKINDLDSKQQQLPSQNKRIYCVVFNCKQGEGYVNKIQFLKQITIFQKLDKSIEERIRKVMGIQQHFVVLNTINL